MSGHGSRHYETPEFYDSEGVALFVDDNEQQISRINLTDSGNGRSDTKNDGSNEENEENGDVTKGGIGGNNNNNDNNDDATEILLDEYRLLRRSAEAFIYTTRRACAELQLKRRRMDQRERVLRRRAELVAATAQSPIMKLNIGGMRFHVQRDTLLQFPMTFFSVLDDEQFPVQKDDQGYVFLDRDPWLFREILFLLRERRQRVVEITQSHRTKSSPSLMLLTHNATARNRLTRLPSLERKRVVEEAKYYGLNELLADLAVIQYQWQNCILVPVPASRYGAGVVMDDREKVQVNPPEGCCFATCVQMYDSVYLFGGCGNHEKVLNSFYRLQLEQVDGEKSQEEHRQKQKQQQLRRSQDDDDDDSDDDDDDSDDSDDDDDDSNDTDDDDVTSDDEDEYEEEQKNDERDQQSFDPGNASSTRRWQITYDLIQTFGEKALARAVVPEPRTGHAMVSIRGRYLLVLYGNDLSRHLNNVWAYHAARNKWSLVNLRGDYLEPRSGHTVTVVRDRLYLIGGKKMFASCGLLCAEVFVGRFDADRMELTWTLLASQQRPQQQQQQQQSREQADELRARRFERRFRSINENRTVSSSRSPATEEANNEEEEETEEMEEGLCDIPPMAYHGAVDWNDRYIITFGGVRWPPLLHPDGRVLFWNAADAARSEAAKRLPHLYQFDTVNLTCKRLHTYAETPNMPTSDIPRSGHFIVRYNDDIYAMGSYNGKHQPHHKLALFQLSLHTRIWRRIETTVAPTHSPPCSRAAPCGVLLPPTKDNGRPMILMYGGYSLASTKYFKDAYILTL
ncbi:Potassium channel tetramerization-type BTB domain [Trypanosoma melophagium]|uniref:Potassium channel tetramerization-type BTB domain n=1 Tax=Trypanosoma melophagium TaxID=715481 RepID=UPI003519FC77|nr:Potassium channel tetramerization-type BTB domain [Trypanosoma melophagium]